MKKALILILIIVPMMGFGLDNIIKDNTYRNNYNNLLLFLGDKYRLISDFNTNIPLFTSTMDKFERLSLYDSMKLKDSWYMMLLNIFPIPTGLGSLIQGDYITPIIALSVDAAILGAGLYIASTVYIYYSWELIIGGGIFLGIVAIANYVFVATAPFKFEAAYNRALKRALSIENFVSVEDNSINNNYVLLRF